MENNILTLLLVSGNEDVRVVANPYCKYCFESKTGVEILREFPITIKEYKELLKYDIERGVKVNCICTDNKV